MTIAFGSHLGGYVIFSRLYCLWHCFNRWVAVLVALLEYFGAYYLCGCRFIDPFSLCPLFLACLADKVYDFGAASWGRDGLPGFGG